MQSSNITYANSQYPEVLRQLPSPPKSLYVRGSLLDQPRIAVVGTRRPSEYGKFMTYKLAAELASAGYTIVSGLAYGLDAVAHRAAIEAGGHTVAVMAGGLDTIYPRSHTGLAAAILESGGALISEYPDGTTSFKSNFVARNRIVAGLCSAVLVTEATAESGTLITANFAKEYNRTVMAVPGAVNSLRSAGPNNLLKSGALVVTDSADIFTELNFTAKTVAATPVRAASAQEAKLIELISNGTNSSQGLIDASGYSAAEFANYISLMEITGKVTNLGAGIWALRGHA